VLRRVDKRTDTEVQQLRLLRAQQTELAEAIDLAQDFAQLVRLRQPTQFDAWLVRASKSTLRPFQRFAKGLSDDYTAIKAGITLRWSNGPVEGQINRLKMLKRQMFGRARPTMQATTRTRLAQAVGYSCRATRGIARGSGGGWERSWCPLGYPSAIKTWCVRESFLALDAGERLRYV
jgi:Transposase